MRGRYAPSPTGDMHLGNARTALVAWLAARARGSSFVMRIEDLDRARVVPGAEERILADLRWLGLDWDEGPDVGGPRGPYRQSERLSLYEAALTDLVEGGRAYPCTCSRADILRAASAPHVDEEGPRYPGTCRARVDIPPAARACRRFRAGPTAFAFDDEVQGAQGRERQPRTSKESLEELPSHPVDDFVLQRADGVFAYQLAVVVDDAAMGIEEVVRAADLLTSTPRQLALYEALRVPAPVFAHLPLVLSPSGERLAKRTRPASLRDLAAQGIAPGALVAALATSIGLTDSVRPCSPRDLVEGFSWARVARAPAVVSLGPEGLVLAPAAPDGPLGQT